MRRYARVVINFVSKLAKTLRELSYRLNWLLGRRFAKPLRHFRLVQTYPLTMTVIALAVHQRHDTLVPNRIEHDRRLIGSIEVPNVVDRINSHPSFDFIARTSGKIRRFRTTTAGASVRDISTSKTIPADT